LQKFRDESCSGWCSFIGKTSQIHRKSVCGKFLGGQNYGAQCEKGYRRKTPNLAQVLALKILRYGLWKSNVDKSKLQQMPITMLNFVAIG